MIDDGYRGYEGGFLGVCVLNNVNKEDQEGIDN